MPGIFGFIGKDMARSISLDHMLQTLLHQDWYQSIKEVRDDVNIGAVSSAPFFSKVNNSAENARYLLLIEGNVVKYKEENLDDSDYFARCLLESYAQNQEGVLKDLDGSFNLIVYDKEEKEITIANDRFGFSYLYYHLDAGNLIFSPEYKSIGLYNKFKKTPNLRAFSLLLSSNAVIGDETHFENIKLLPPATILKFKHGSFSLKEYWRPEFNALNDVEEGYFIDQAMELYRQALEKRVSGRNREKIILPLSGGLDSRLLFGMMTDKKEFLDLYTYGDRKCLDYKVARQVVSAREAHASHSLVRLTPDMIYSNALETVRLNEGHVDFSSSICRGIAEFIGPGPYTFLNGIIGAHMSLGSQNFFGSEEIQPGRQVKDVDKHVFRILGLSSSRRFFNMYLRDEYVDAFVDSGQQVALENFKKFGSNELFCDQKDLFMNYNLGRRMMGNIDLFKFYFHDVHPFIDYDLFKLYSEIPPKLKIGHYLYQKLIIKYYPQLAAIPWTNTGRNLFVKDLLQRKNSKRQVKEKLLYYVARLSNGKISLKNNDTYIHNSVWLRKDTNFRNFVIENIKDIDRLQIDFLDSKKIMELMRLHDQGRDHLFNLISRIVTVVLWYKLFMDDEGSTAEFSHD